MSVVYIAFKSTIFAQTLRGVPRVAVLLHPLPGLLRGKPHLRREADAGAAGTRGQGPPGGGEDHCQDRPAAKGESLFTYTQ